MKYPKKEVFLFIESLLHVIFHFPVPLLEPDLGLNLNQLVGPGYLYPMGLGLFVQPFLPF